MIYCLVMALVQNELLNITSLSSSNQSFQNTSLPHCSSKTTGGGVCVCTSTAHGVEMYRLYTSTAHLIWSFYCWGVTPFIYQGNLHAFLAAVYIRLRTNSTNALSNLYDIIRTMETDHPHAIFIVAGDFNRCNLWTILPKYHQHVDIPTQVKGLFVWQSPFCQNWEKDFCQHRHKCQGATNVVLAGTKVL